MSAKTTDMIFETWKNETKKALAKLPVFTLNLLANSREPDAKAISKEILSERADVSERRKIGFTDFSGRTR